MLKDIIKEKNISIYRLSKESNIPYMTLNDIYNERVKLEKCTAETVYKLSKVLDVSMEDLVKTYIEKPIPFELFKSDICHELKNKGDIQFLIDILSSGIIIEYYREKMFAKCLYLLAMVDYISRINNIPICSDYDYIRSAKLSEPLFPSGILAICASEKSSAIKQDAINNAIPEFIRHNIIECEVRNVI